MRRLTAAATASAVPILPTKLSSAVDVLHEQTAIPQCLYYFGLNYVPFDRSVAAIGKLLVQWVKDKGFDGALMSKIK